VSEELGHVAIIDPNPRRGGVPEEKLFDPAMKERYKQRTTAERGNSRLKDECGLRHGKFVQTPSNEEKYISSAPMW
jgi:hypothetical protein